MCFLFWYIRFRHHGYVWRWSGCYVAGNFRGHRRHVHLRHREVRRRHRLHAQNQDQLVLEGEQNKQEKHLFLISRFRFWISLGF
jgi:hypothetical protein